MAVLGSLLYVIVLLLNAIAVLSEDRFLARIGFSAKSHDPAFGQAGPDQSVKGKIVSLIASVRMIMRGMITPTSRRCLGRESLTRDRATAQ